MRTQTAILLLLPAVLIPLTHSLPLFGLDFTQFRSADKQAAIESTVSTDDADRFLEANLDMWIRPMEYPNDCKNVVTDKAENYMCDRGKPGSKPQLYAFATKWTAANYETRFTDAILQDFIDNPADESKNEKYFWLKTEGSAGSFTIENPCLMKFTLPSVKMLFGDHTENYQIFKYTRIAGNEIRTVSHKYSCQK